MSIKLNQLALMALALTAAFPAAAETYHGFVKDPWYLGKGGETVGLQAFAENPLEYLRGETAYKGLKEHFGQVVGKPLTDEEFRELLRSEDVRLVKCIGRINTAGVSDTGRFGWHERACYKNEYLIQVRVPGGWMTAASQGCYNPVEGERPPAPPPPPPEKKPASPPKLSIVPIPVLPAGPSPSIRGFIPDQTRVYTINPTYNACIPLYTPGVTAVVPGSPIMTVRH